MILWAVRWYCRYPISYRDLEEMLAERGISGRLIRRSIAGSSAARRWRSGCAGSERRGFDRAGALDETYVRCGDKWTYRTPGSRQAGRRSISTCRRPAAPRQRSGSWAKACEA